MQNGKPKTGRANLGRIILLSAVIGLTVGAALWFWQNPFNQPQNGQIAIDNVNRRAAVENTKPIVLSGNLPATDRELEFLGDKLAEASFHLREQENEPARQTLVEADELAHKNVDDPQLQQTILSGIEQCQNDLAGGKIKEVEQEIGNLLNQLNMPEN